MKIYQLLALLFVLGCSEPEKTLSEENRTAIKISSSRLVASLTDHDFAVFRKLWSEKRFKNRIRNLTNPQKSVLKWYLDKRLAIDILNWNNEMVTSLSLNSGMAKVSRIQHFPNYSEVVVSFAHGTFADFIKYRFEIENNQPVVSDYFVYKENEWFSDLIKNNLNWNSNNNAYSEGRRDLWQAISLSNGALEAGDTLSAIRLLDTKIVKDFTGNGLLIKKLNLASLYDPILFEEMLAGEVAQNQTLYMRYTLAYYQLDTIQMTKICNELVKVTGEDTLVDSLRSFKYFWHK